MSPNEGGEGGAAKAALVFPIATFTPIRRVAGPARSYTRQKRKRRHAIRRAVSEQIVMTFRTVCRHPRMSSPWGKIDYELTTSFQLITNCTIRNTI